MLQSCFVIVLIISGLLIFKVQFNYILRSVRQFFSLHFILQYLITYWHASLLFIHLWKLEAQMFIACILDSSVSVSQAYINILPLVHPLIFTLVFCLTFNIKANLIYGNLEGNPDVFSILITWFCLLCLLIFTKWYIMVIIP